MKSRSELFDACILGQIPEIFHLFVIINLGALKDQRVSYTKWYHYYNCCHKMVPLFYIAVIAQVVVWFDMRHLNQSMLPKLIV